MAFSVVFGSNCNIFAHNHRHRLRRLHRPELRVSIQRTRSLRVSPVIAPPECCVLTLASCGDGGSTDVNPGRSVTSKDINVFDSNDGSKDGNIGQFVQMLGIDNDPVDRDHAVVALWKYSDGGRDSIDSIMIYPGCLSLILELMKSENPSTSEAAAGLLRNISSVDLYRDILVEGGVIEELSWLLHQSFLTLGVKEQLLCILWNLSIEEKLRFKIAHGDLLPLLIKLLGDEELKVKEAVGSVLENLSLSPFNHNIMVESGVIPKLTDLLKSNTEGLKYVRRAANSVLLELSKHDYYNTLIIEDGLIRVPLVGSSAYKSFKPQPHSWPSLPDGTELERSSRPSRYGATDLLLGLTVRAKNINLDEAKVNAMVGRSQQQFLARIGAVELDDRRRSESGSSLNQQHTFLPWMDGVARLVLLLGLEDVSAITKSAKFIAEASINEHLRLSFKEAGAIKRLLQLLSHDDKAVQEAAVYALDRLCLSYEVRRTVEAEGMAENVLCQSVLKTEMDRKANNE